MPRPGASRQNRKRHGKKTATAGRSGRWRDRLAAGRESRRLLVATAVALGLHGAALVGLTRSSGRPPGRIADVAGTVVPAEIVSDPIPPASLPLLRPGRVIESVGAAAEEPPTEDTRRIAERNASTETESRRAAAADESGRRIPSPRTARAAAPPRAPAAQTEGAGGVTIAAPDAGAAAQTTADAGSSATAASDPGGQPTGISLGLADHSDDDLSDVPMADETRLRANVSSYAAFLNEVRDRVRKVWRVREVYQSADPARRFRGDELVTELAVRVGADGSVAGVSVNRGSGLEPVDEEAAAAVRRAGPFSPPAGIADPDGGLSFQFSFTFDLSPMRFLTATRQALMERWRPSRAFRQVGDRHRVTAVRVLLRPDGTVAQINPVASAGIDFLDAGALEACKPGDRLPTPPESFRKVIDGMVPLWVEFQHRVGSPGDIRVMRRYQPTERR